MRVSPAAVNPKGAGRTASLHGNPYALTSIDLSGRISVILHEKSRKRNLGSDFQAQGRFMKEVAILLLVALMLNGCSSSSAPAQVSSNETWQAQLSGGESSASGFSFNTQFAINSNGALSITSFQFLNYNGSTSCFPVSGGTVSGTMVLSVSTTSEGSDQVTGPFTFVVQSGGNALNLTGTVTGTAPATQTGTSTTLNSGATVTGTWTLAGGTGCNDAVGGSFSMTLSSSTN
jgi:hypothetical protein